FITLRSFLHTEASPEKHFNLDDHFDRSFLFMTMKGKLLKSKKKEPTKERAKTRTRKLPGAISVEEALRCPSVSIRVPDGKEMTVGPFNAQPQGFRLAEIKNFEDLHRL